MKNKDKNKCKAKDDCTREAKYKFQGVETCEKCLTEHIHSELIDDAVLDYIDMNAQKL